MYRNSTKHFRQPDRNPDGLGSGEKEEEHDRQYLEQTTIKILLNGRSFGAPVEQILTTGGRALDVGVGCGHWVMDMAASFPNSSFIGIDIKPYFPLNIMPKNCEFEVMDARMLRFPENHFDYIYQRTMMTSHMVGDWQPFIEKLLPTLKPGGWLELVETLFEYENEGTVCSKFVTKSVEAMTQNGMDIKIGRKLATYCKNAGFVNVEEKVFTVPIGKWGGNVGSIMAEMNHVSVEYLKPFIQPSLNLTDKQFEEHQAAISREWDENRTTSKYIVVLAQKPE